MSGRHLSYPCAGDVPALFVNIINARTRRKRLFQMLVDTGASHTAIPATFASSFGHDNSAHGVATTQAKGIGGTSPAFVHTLRFELIDPTAQTWNELVPPWRSPKLPVLFVERMDTQMGLIGRDIISLWKKVAFSPARRRRQSNWTVEITLGR
jgi:hypothetical protein